MNEKFIYTFDEKTKEQLEAAGFQLINQTSSGHWIFLAKQEMVFENIENVFFSNTLTF